MARRKLGWLLLTAIVLPLIAWGCEQFFTVQKWIGSTDLEIVFVVTSAATGQPIDNAQVEIQSDGGAHRNASVAEFVLNTDAEGRARHVCYGNKIAGSDGPLQFADSIAIQLPDWQFRIRAKGHAPNTWTALDSVPYLNTAREVAPGQAQLLVPIALHQND